MSEDKVIFVVDTTSYAGNFERPMTAYVTGQIGDCGVGEEEVKEFRDGHPGRVDEFVDLMMLVPDDNGCFRPASIYPTPGWFNDGHGNHWPDDADPVAVKALFDKTVANYYKGRPKEIPEYEGNQCPAYQSVAMFMYKVPSQETLAFMMRRAIEFANNHKSWDESPSPITITGFRVLKESTETTIHQVWEGP